MVATRAVRVPPDPPRCLCGLMSDRTATVLIGVLELLAFGAQVGNLVYMLQHGVQQAVANDNTAVVSFLFSTTFMYIQLVFFTVSLVVVLLALWGVHAHDHRFLLPHLVWQVLTVTVCVIGCSCLAYALYKSEALDQSILALYTAGLAAAILLEFYFFFIVMQLYKWLQHVNAYEAYVAAKKKQGSNGGAGGDVYSVGHHSNHVVGFDNPGFAGAKSESYASTGFENPNAIGGQHL